MADRDPLLRAYYDEEWGVPVTDERGLFERLVLEAFQSGLSWRTVLAKRPRFREVFAGFDADAVAAFGDAEVEALLVPDPDDRVDALGLKGLGELGNVGTASAIANAVYHATGKRIRSFPLRNQIISFA